MTTEQKFYCAPESAWGANPQVNLNRLNQNTFWTILSSGKIDGFVEGVYCPEPKNLDVEALKKVSYEISEELYREKLIESNANW